MGKYSRRQIDNILSYFSQKIGFDISCKLWNVKAYALWKIMKKEYDKKKKKKKNVVWWIFYPAC